MSRFSRIGLFLGLTLGVLALDQWVKAWTRANLNIGQSWEGGPLPGIFELTLSYNKGVAFGAFQGFALFAAPIAIGIAIACGVSAWRKGGPLRILAVSLMASGALGNLYDRLFDARGVTDMFLLRLSNLTGGRLGDFPVFNVADAAITLAVILLAIIWIKEDAKRAKHETAPEGEPTQAPSSLAEGQ